MIKSLKLQKHILDNYEQISVGQWNEYTMFMFRDRPYYGMFIPTEELCLKFSDRYTFDPERLLRLNEISTIKAIKKLAFESGKRALTVFESEDGTIKAYYDTKYLNIFRGIKDVRYELDTEKLPNLYLYQADRIIGIICPVNYKEA